MSQHVPASQRLFGLSILGVAAVGLAAYLGFLPIGVESGGAPKDRLVNVSRNDPDMQRAIQRARDTLPKFWNRLAQPAADESAFAVKLAIVDGDAVEHMWCGSIQGDARKAKCTIDNEAETVKTVKLGQTLDIDPAIISDWMYMKQGRIKGGETIRVLVSRMPEAEAASYSDLLANE